MSGKLQKKVPKLKSKKSDLGGDKKKKTEKKRKVESLEEEKVDVLHVNKVKRIESKPNKHKDELVGLADKDPEFFKFLQENDAGLLDFDDDLSDDEINSDYDELHDGIEDEKDSDGDNDNDNDNDNDKEDDMCEMGEAYDDGSDNSVSDTHNENVRRKAALEVSLSLLNSLLKKTLEGSFSALKKILSILRAACAPANDSRSKGGRSTVNAFSVTSPEVYEKVMTTVIESVHVALYKHLGLNKSPNQNSLLNIERNAKWKKLQLYVLSFFKSILHTLAGLVDSTQQDQVTVYLISSLEHYIPLLAPLPRLAKGVIKVLLAVWARDTLVGDKVEGEVGKLDYESKGQAFLRVRQMAMQV